LYRALLLPDRPILLQVDASFTERLRSKKPSSGQRNEQRSSSQVHWLSSLGLPPCPALTVCAYCLDALSESGR
jgi:hypothetical protein